VSTDPYELGMTRPARRAISELLPEDVAAAAVEFITGPLLKAPYRVGRPLRDTLSGFHSARLGTEWRVLYRIDESKRAVIVHDVQRRSTASLQHQVAGCGVVALSGTQRPMIIAYKLGGTGTLPDTVSG
jgi:mRNA interferase RelE/StbE